MQRSNASRNMQVLRWIGAAAFAAVAAAGLWFAVARRQAVVAPATRPSASARPAPSAAAAVPAPGAAADAAGAAQRAEAPAPADLIAPISGAAARVTKKPFGLYVTPRHSPVQPERFSGYHAGVDFETLPSEQDTDVPIVAACDGTLLLKKWATGYGGVAVQSCRVAGQDVTVIYGHLRLASVKAVVGQVLAQGREIGVLGTGYGAETDGERKHLHFGIHKGKAIDIKGYEQTKPALAAWLDAEALLGF